MIYNYISDCISTTRESESTMEVRTVTRIDEMAKWFSSIKDKLIKESRIKPSAEISILQHQVDTQQKLVDEVKTRKQELLDLLDAETNKHAKLREEIHSVSKAATQFVEYLSRLLCLCQRFADNHRMLSEWVKWMDSDWHYPDSRVQGFINEKISTIEQHQMVLSLLLLLGQEIIKVCSDEDGVAVKWIMCNHMQGITEFENRIRCLKEEVETELKISP